MSILDLISKAAGLAGPELLKLLQYVKDNAPDLAPEAEKAIQALSEAVGPTALGALGVAVVKELTEIGGGKFDGRHHPSDVG